MAKPTFYLTTAISYPNGAPHIGHAYELIACDAIARFKRLDGFDVHFLTGTDEHGLKMLKTARDANIPVQELADKNAEEFKRMCKALNASNDDFIRTSEPRHHKASQALWKAMQEQGDIYKGSYSGWYSVRDEAYYDESETTKDDNGDRLGPQGTPVEWIEEESYFFKLSEYQDKLLEFYNANPDFIAPSHRKNEIVNFIKGGLNDLSISRTTFDWGVKVPNDESHVMYVWVDALTNYMTALGYPDTNDAKWQFWPADVHVIGKDIVRFHTIYWPAFLMSAGLEIPKRVFGHGFLFNKDEKMSKSVGNVIDPFTIAEEYGVDSIRYFLLREIAFGQDGSYSHESIVNRTNSELANGLGNLAQRSLSMIFKNCDGKIIKPQNSNFTDADKSLLDHFVINEETTDLKSIRSYIDSQEIHTALGAIYFAVDAGNQYFDDNEPWSLKDKDPERMKVVLYTVAEILRQVGIMLQPFIPESAEKLLDVLGVGQSERTFASLGDALESIELTEAPQGIFPRYVDKESK